MVSGVLWGDERFCWWSDLALGSARLELEQQETHTTMLSNMSIFADWGLIRNEECTKHTLWRVRCLQMQRQDLWLIQIRLIACAQTKEGHAHNSTVHVSSAETADW